MKRAIFRVGMAALLGLLGGCAPLPPAQPEPQFLLLGEVHDNAVQHRLRAERLAKLLADGLPTTIVFEQLPAARNDALLAQQRLAPRDVEALIDAGKLDRRNWRWPLHKPLFQAAANGAARILGGNLEREELRRLMREGDTAWPADALALAQRTPWSDAQQRAQLKAIDEGHCGALPAAMHQAMALAQRARDATMASVMLAARDAGARRVVLIAGNGHVDRELGVPRYLEGAGVPASAIRVIGYLEAGTPGGGRYDERIETQTSEREDACKQFRPSPS